jgi:hypothetical protein
MRKAKRNFYLGGLRLAEVEVGRFCEAAYRILEFITSGSFIALGVQLKTDPPIDKLEQLPKTAAFFFFGFSQVWIAQLFCGLLAIGVHHGAGGLRQRREGH